MDYSSLKIKNLKTLLKERSLVAPKKASKEVLISLLENNDKQDSLNQKLLEKYSTVKPIDKHRDTKIQYYLHRLTVETNLKDKIGYMRSLEKIGYVN